MNTTLESLATGWSTADEAFFRIAAEIFPPAFLAGAGVLLASYDPDPVEDAPCTPSAAAPRGAVSVPA